MDEEDVLLGTAPCDIGSLSEVDEAAVLGDDVLPEANIHKDSLEEKEELDYDEDLDEETEKTPRSSKFASERVDHHRLSVQSTDVSSEYNNREGYKKESFPQISTNHDTGGATTVASQKPLPLKQIHSGRKVFMNPHHRGNINAQQEITLNWGNLSSVNTAPPNVQARPYMSTVPQVAPIMHPYATVPSSSADFSKPPPPMVSLSNYATPPPAYHMTYPSVPQQAAIPPVDDWRKKVANFIDRISVPARSLHHYSNSRSRSSSSFSRSRSRSYSSRSSSFSYSSRSSHSSRRNSRMRGHRSLSRHSSSRHLRRRSRSRSRREERGRSATEKHLGRFDEHKSQNRRKGFRQDSNHQEKTMECAKAIGLDIDYLSKLEEQKKMREEILRKKEERRFQNVQRMGASENPIRKDEGKNYGGFLNARRNEPLAERSLHAGNGDAVKSEKRLQRVRPLSKGTLRSTTKNGIKDGTSTEFSKSSYKSSNSDGKVAFQMISRKNTETSTQSSDGVVRPTASEQDIRRARIAHIKETERNIQSFSSSVSNNQDKIGKKKAYLAVVIGTVSKEVPDLEKMKLVASTVGPVKKAWISSENNISVVFESHDSAKQFMFKYNGKVIKGVTLCVSLQKVFANLAEL